MLRQQIIEMIREKKQVSFVNLQSIPGFTGEYLYARGPIVLWNNMSLDAIRIMDDLIVNDIIKGTPCSPMTYAIDGQGLSLPIVQQYTRPYKTNHWLPLEFDVI